MTTIHCWLLVFDGVGTGWWCFAVGVCSVFAGGVSYLINQTLISGDVIFAGSMGRANSSWIDLFNSITQKVLRLPDVTGLHPGHGPATTVGQEKEHNPFFLGRVR